MSPPALTEAPQPQAATMVVKINSKSYGSTTPSLLWTVSANPLLIVLTCASSYLVITRFGFCEYMRFSALLRHKPYV